MNNNFKVNSKFNILNSFNHIYTQNKLNKLFFFEKGELDKENKSHKKSLNYLLIKTENRIIYTEKFY